MEIKDIQVLHIIHHSLVVIKILKDSYIAQFYVNTMFTNIVFKIYEFCKHQEIF